MAGNEEEHLDGVGTSEKIAISEIRPGWYSKKDQDKLIPLSKAASFLRKTLGEESKTKESFELIKTALLDGHVNALVSLSYSEKPIVKIPPCYWTRMAYDDGFIEKNNSNNKSRVSDTIKFLDFYEFFEKYAAVDHGFDSQIINLIRERAAREGKSDLLDVFIRKGELDEYVFSRGGNPDMVYAGRRRKGRRPLPMESFLSLIIAIIIQRKNEINIREVAQKAASYLEVRNNLQKIDPKQAIEAIEDSSGFVRRIDGLPGWINKK